MPVELHFRVGEMNAAADLVEGFHYSGRMPSNVQCVGTLHEPGGLFGDYGDAVAACIFTIPPTRWSEPLLELARLVRKDDITVSLTGLIAKTVDHIRREKMADLLVSFADWTQGHHGGIYQAASWNYNGKRDRRLDGIMFRGEFFAGRAANHKWGTRSPLLLKERGLDIEAHWDEGKHLYWKPLGRQGKAKAVRLGLKCLPYPKPAVAQANRKGDGPDMRLSGKG